MITTTLKRIRAHSPCAHGWEKLLHGLGKTRADDEPLPYATILRINGLHDALWCCRAESKHSKEWRIYIVWCARQCEYLLTDPRSIHAIDTAERYALGTATEEELNVVRGAAWDAVRDGGDAEWVAARTTVGSAVGDAVMGAAFAASEDEDRVAQSIEFLRIVEGENP
jgi:uncharacterized protein YaiE (UPF0345 family)